MKHTYKLTGSKSIHSIVKDKVNKGIWSLDDTVDFYRGSTKVFEDDLLVRYHYDHFIDTSNYEYRKVI